MFLLLVWRLPQSGSPPWAPHKGRRLSILGCHMKQRRNLRGLKNIDDPGQDNKHISQKSSSANVSVEFSFKREKLLVVFSVFIEPLWIIANLIGKKQEQRSQTDTRNDCWSKFKLRSFVSGFCDMKTLWGWENKSGLDVRHVVLLFFVYCVATREIEDQNMPIKNAGKMGIKRHKITTKYIQNLSCETLDLFTQTFRRCCRELSRNQTQGTRRKKIKGKKTPTSVEKKSDDWSGVWRRGWPPLSYQIH